MPKGSQIRESSQGQPCVAAESFFGAFQQTCSHGFAIEFLTGIFICNAWDGDRLQFFCLSLSLAAAISD
jgi:hypothetical protein